MIGIVVSRADRASEHIGEHLLELASWEQSGPGVYTRPGFELREFEELHLDIDQVAERFSDPDYVVFASRHSGETGPLLSAHYTGNFGEADYGGNPGELSEPTPRALAHVLDHLEAAAPAGYDVAMECTHHGPTDHGAPGMFVELGSGPDQWDDPAGARAVATAILSLEGVEPFGNRTLVAFGGNHYAPRPTRIIAETEFGVGHVAANWGLEALGDPAEKTALLKTMFQASDAECAIVEGEHPKVRSAISELGYRVVSETWVRETSGFDPDLVAAVEADLGTIESGVRFGSVHPADRRFEVCDLPTELLAECHGIDAEATVGAVSKHVIAYQSEENGNRVGERCAIPAAEDYETIVHSLIGVLEDGYEAVEYDGATVVAERSAFDPSAAASMGVPEGPQFGRLAAGETVTVDGKTVEPEDVHVTEIRRFEV